MAIAKTDDALIEALIEGLGQRGIKAERWGDTVIATLPGGYRVTLAEIREKRIVYPARFCREVTVLTWSGEVKSYSDKKVQTVLSKLISRYNTMAEAYTKFLETSE